MKKLIFLLMCVLSVGVVNAQDKVYKNNEVDVIAEPYEGIATFYQTVAKEINVANIGKLPSEKVDFRIYFVVEKTEVFQILM